MQLINTSVYDKETQKRTKAIEESRKKRLQQRDETEVAKVMTHLQHINANMSSTSASNKYRVFVHEIPFQVAQGGSKLIRESGRRTAVDLGNLHYSRLPDDPTAAKATPKRAEIGGVTFLRSKNGNLHRLGAVKARR